jgi:hypothetical protein
MKTAEENYIPYGEEWKNELMKLSKVHIISLYRMVCLALKEDEEKIKSHQVEPLSKEAIPEMVILDLLINSPIHFEPNEAVLLAEHISGYLSEKLSELFTSKVKQDESLLKESGENLNKQDDKPTAFEFHNYEAGHCYVDYISRVGQDVRDGYTKLPLYRK